MLRVIRATYYDPQIGLETGDDVTEQVASEVRSGQLIYNGKYNDIFPDHFKRIKKKLRIEVEYKGKTDIRYYNEDERINLPTDLGIKSERWWEHTWFQGIALIASLIAIGGFIRWIFY